MTIYRRCPQCHQLFTGKRCEECWKKYSARFNKKARKNDEHMKFYESSAWKKCRRDVRLKYMDYDIWMLAIGELVKCDKPFIHHVIPKKEAPDLIFDIDNLVTVSKESHEQIHYAYEHGSMEAAIARINEGKEKFRRMFTDD